MSFLLFFFPDNCWHDIVGRLRQLDQRFADPIEANFKESLEPDFFLPLFVGSAVGAVATCFRILRYFYMAEIVDRTLSTMIVGCGLLMLTIHLSVFLYSLAKRRSLKFILPYRLLATAYLVILGVVANFDNWWQASKLFGKNPDHLFPEGTGISSEDVLLLQMAFYGQLTLLGPISFRFAWIPPTTSGTAWAIIRWYLYARGEPLPSFQFGYFLAVCASGLFASFRLEALHREKWLAKYHVKVQEGRLQTQHQGVCRILTRFCDCLVQVGSDFTIIEPNEKFAALMMFDGGQRIQGANFCDYIHTKDRQSFREAAIKAMSVGTEYTEMLPIRLTDSHNRSFSVQVYYTCFRARNGQAGYLIGIVETQERLLVDSDFKIERPTLSEEGDYIDALQAHRRDPFNVESESSDWTPFDENSSKSWTTRSEEDSNEVSFTFIDDERLTLVHTSQLFSSLSGPHPVGESLLALVSNPQKVQNMCQHLGNTFYNAGQELEGLRLRFTEGIEYRLGACSIGTVTTTPEGNFGFHVKVDAVNVKTKARGFGHLSAAKQKPKVKGRIDKTRVSVSL